MTASPGTLRLILGDQLSDSISSLSDIDLDRDTVLMAEVLDEASYVRHHKQKLVLVFSAMRQFADRLTHRGVTVRYTRLGDDGAARSIAGEVLRALEEGDFGRVVVTEPGEWRLAEAFEALKTAASVEVEIRADTRFVCSRHDFEDWAEGKRALRMEFFYRRIRQETGLLMDDGEPAGGQWNYDTENRKRLPRDVAVPAPIAIPPNPTTRAVIAEVSERFADNFGTLDAFGFPTNAAEAEAVCDYFLGKLLPRFGDYQDFMSAGDPFLWHAHISAALNIGLLDARDICRRAEAEYRAGRAPLNAVEGFIRQIVGWREYVRGIYWLMGPDYRKTNALRADRALPWFYWSGETAMACVRDVVTVTRDRAYAHHIQRLMVTGNLAMLLGVHPDAINDWYMVVYADAFEWVELPNTHGMATFADGGRMASKPYAASGAYINRMSNYCAGCAYDVKKRVGDDACPFNALYWGFLVRNRDRLAGNVRMAMPYRNLAAMSAGDREALVRRSDALRDEFCGPAADGADSRSISG